MSGLLVGAKQCGHVTKSDRAGDERGWCVACLRADSAELRARVAELERELTTANERMNYSSAMKWSDKARQAEEARDAAIKERDEARAELNEMKGNDNDFE